MPLCTINCYNWIPSTAAVRTCIVIIPVFLITFNITDLSVYLNTGTRNLNFPMNLICMTCFKSQISVSELKIPSGFTASCYTARFFNSNMECSVTSQLKCLLSRVSFTSVPRQSLISKIIFTKYLSGRNAHRRNCCNCCCQHCSSHKTCSNCLCNFVMHCIPSLKIKQKFLRFLALLCIIVYFVQYTTIFNESVKNSF